MFRGLIFFLFLCMGVNSHAQSLYAQTDTPSDTHSIVTNYETEIICKSPTRFVEKRSRTIVVLNNKGIEAATFVCWCDQFSSLQKFSGEILNAAGKSVRKLKKSDLERSEYSTSLATDEYVYYYECKYPTFPFSIKYTWEVKTDNGYIGFPSFSPQTDFNQFVQQASYRIELPIGQVCRYHEANSEGLIKIKESKKPDGGQIIEATASKLPPIRKEPLSLNFSELAPQVYFAPSSFQFDKTEGNMSTWQSYGAWLYSLLEGNDVLSEDLKQTLHKLTDHLKYDKDKVKVLYDYLAENTRYVSIQLGIGGWKPIAAEEVARNGFGDCKGLSNYLKAMLKEIGIPSVYTVISTDNERLIPDFSSANQMNHVILQVPLPQDTLWLECTNASLPFGYIHQSISGHDGLLIEPTGGRIYQLPSYLDSLNTQQIVANVVLSSANETQINVAETSRNLQYENRIGIIYKSPEEQKEIIRSDINLQQADIDNLQIDEHKSCSPTVTCHYVINSKQYGNQTGSRLFVPINIFRKGLKPLQNAVRTTPIAIKYGYVDTDSICIQIPEEYSIEGFPRSFELKNQFGIFYSSIKVERNKIKIIHQLMIRRGTYSPKEFVPFNDFLRQISKQYDSYIVLRKE